MNIAEMMEKLMDTDANAAYQVLKELAAASENSDVVYGYMNIFSKMISHKNSYIRTRGLILIAANAKWDTDTVSYTHLDVYKRQMHTLDTSSFIIFHEINPREILFLFLNGFFHSPVKIYL